MGKVKKVYEKQLNSMLIRSNANLQMVCKSINVKFLTKEQGWDFYA
jgi:hypothetical protein